MSPCFTASKSSPWCSDSSVEALERFQIKGFGPQIDAIHYTRIKPILSLGPVLGMVEETG